MNARSNDGKTGGASWREYGRLVLASLEDSKERLDRLEERAGLLDVEKAPWTAVAEVREKLGEKASSKDLREMQASFGTQIREMSVKVATNSVKVALVVTVAVAVLSAALAWLRTALGG